MKKSTFLDALAQKVLIFDGAIGTELYSRGYYINRPFEELNLSSALDVKAVHRDYLEAGADVISTNSFSIPTTQLAKFDIASQQKRLIEASLRNAQEAILEFKDPQNTKYISFAVGPLGELVEPLGKISKEEVFREYAQIATHLSESPIQPDLISFETFTNLTELQSALEGFTSKLSSIPILAQISTQVGQAKLVQDFAEQFGSHTSGAQILGLNCSEGPSQIFTDLQILARLTTKPLIVQPNAGIPRQINGRYFYMTSPDYLAKYARRYVEAGASAVGACCGTSPQHIRAIAQALKVSNSQKKARIEITQQSKTPNSPELKPLGWDQRQSSKLGRYLKDSRKIISIEVTPPKGTQTAKFFSDLEQLMAEGLEFVNIPDGPRASTRISSLHLSAAVVNKFQSRLTPIPHFTTRDRNLIALQADLLGASINGVSEVLIVTGDPPKVGNNKDATAVYDIDSIGLTHLTHCLNHGKTPQGDDLGSSTGFAIGVASNPTAINLDLELSRWIYKCQMGADFAITQPIYDPDVYQSWLDKIGNHFRPHVVGIWPFVSLRNAEFMANEVPGVHVPAWAIEEMAKAGDDRNEAQKRGIDIAIRVIEKITPYCAGVSISAPLGRTEVALEVLKFTRRKFEIK